MAENKESGVIDFREILRRLHAKRKKFILPMAITFVLSCVYIFSQPRYYTTEAKLAPESENPMMGGALGSIVSSFGMDFGGSQTGDAINPLLYPDLMDDNAFVYSLFDVKVRTNDGTVKTTYYDYLRKYQKKPWWNGFTSWFNGLFKSKKPAESRDTTAEVNPYVLSETDYKVLQAVQGKISFLVDEKYGVITVRVKDQDPAVCKTMADSVIIRLQDFITDYRTSKARIDVDYYTALVDSAWIEYSVSSQRYARFADANTNVTLQSYRTQLEDMENDMQLKYNTYSALMTQLQSAKGKVQERTPAFTILKGASVPLRPAGPKRMMFVFSMLLLAFVISGVVILRKDLTKMIVLREK